MSFVIAVFVVWRLTHMVNIEYGPYEIFFKFRGILKKGGFWFELTTCFLCLSVWFGLAVALYREGLHLSALYYALALSGGACVIEQILPMR